MTAARRVTVLNFGLRLAYSAFMLARPDRIGGPWLGRPRPAASGDVPLRGVAGREIALHAAGIAALLDGAPSRPWLLASLGGDVTDIVASVAQREQLPDGGLRAVLLTGGGSVAFTVALLATARD